MSVRTNGSAAWRRVGLSVGLGVVLLAAGSARAGTPDEMTVAVCGLRVVAPGLYDEHETRAFYQDPGVTVVLRVVRAAGGLIALDEAASEIQAFADDKGTVLFKPEGFSKSPLGSWPKVTAGGKVAVIEIEGNQRPAAEARQIQLKGKLALKVATEQKVYPAKVKLAAGTKIEAGPVPFTIKEVGKPEWGDAQLQITLHATQNLDALAGVRFLDADGTEIESSESGSMTMTTNDEVQIDQSYDLAKAVDELTIELTYWTDMHTVTVPFEKTFSIGL